MLSARAKRERGLLGTVLGRERAKKIAERGGAVDRLPVQTGGEGWHTSV